MMAPKNPVAFADVRYPYPTRSDCKASTCVLRSPKYKDWVKILPLALVGMGDASDIAFEEITELDDATIGVVTTTDTGADPGAGVVTIILVEGDI